jgi:hypothetical protein
MERNSFVVGTPSDVAKYAKALRTRRVKHLSMIRIAGEVPQLAEVLALSQLSQIRELSLQGTAPNWQNLAVPTEAMAALAACRYLGGVRKLTLDENLLNDGGADALAGAPWLRKIEELSITKHPNLSGTGFALLAAQLRCVRRLYVAHCTLRAIGGRGLAAGPLPLEDLYLDTCRIEEAGAAAIFGSKILDRTTRVKINYDLLGSALPCLTPRANLRALELPRCSISTESVAAFARGGCHPALTLLDLSDNLLEDPAASALASSSAFPVLEKLDLRANQLGPLGVGALGASSGLPALKQLGIDENKLFTGATHIHEWPGGMWQAGSMVVNERVSLADIQARLIKRPDVRVF